MHLHRAAAVGVDADLLRRLFYILGSLALIAWAAGYIWISGLACAFSQSQSCDIPAPWSLRGEDLIMMVLIPGGITGALLLIGWALGRKRS